MSASRSTTSAKASKAPAKPKKPRGGKGPEIGRELEAKRQREGKATPKPEWHKYIKDDGNREGNIEEITNDSKAIPWILRFHPLDDIASRLVGWKLGKDRKARVKDDGRTIEIYESDGGFIKPIRIIGVLPEGYSATFVRDLGTYYGWWVGSCDDIAELERRNKAFEEADEQITSWLTGQDA